MVDARLEVKRLSVCRSLSDNSSYSSTDLNRTGPGVAMLLRASAYSHCSEMSRLIRRSKALLLKSKY
jgi:hypothetical protein